MTPKRQRSVLRAIHIGLSFGLGVYVYAPIEEVGGLRLLCQVILVPALAVTGLWMWQQGRVNRWLRRRRQARGGAAASEATE